MPYNLFFPSPVAHFGMFRARKELIEHNQAFLSHESSCHFAAQLPTISDIVIYCQLLKPNNLSNEYLGNILSYKDPWRPLAGFADLAILDTAIEHILTNNLTKSYVMTNSAGHHANNARYELFCPLNQLFFLVEKLNQAAAFPNIAWIDIDAHFGNGDKELFDLYKKRMMSESNNLAGVSLHTDGLTLRENNYVCYNYEETISEADFLQLLAHSLTELPQSKYILLFFGTDIFAGDYGNNSQLTLDILS